MIAAMADPTEPREAPARPSYLFDAVLTPHRSLGPRGFWLLMAGIVAVSFAAGIAFLLAGAWPIFGFFGLDVLLVYWAFKASYRSGRLREVVRLTERELTVERISPAGRVRRWSFEPYWLRVELDDRPRHASQLRLTSHGKALSIGAFLSPQERGEVASELRIALARCR